MEALIRSAGRDAAPADDALRRGAGRAPARVVRRAAARGAAEPARCETPASSRRRGSSGPGSSPQRVARVPPRDRGRRVEAMRVLRIFAIPALLVAVLVGAFATTSPSSGAHIWPATSSPGVRAFESWLFDIRDIADETRKDASSTTYPRLEDCASFELGVADAPSERFGAVGSMTSDAWSSRRSRGSAQRSADGWSASPSPQNDASRPRGRPSSTLIRAKSLRGRVSDA